MMDMNYDGYELWWIWTMMDGSPSWYSTNILWLFLPIQVFP